jgi:hypothetical protein
MHGAPILVCGFLNPNLRGITWPRLDTHLFELGLTTVPKIKRCSKNMTPMGFVFNSSQGRFF